MNMLKRSIDKKNNYKRKELIELVQNLGVVSQRMADNIVSHTMHVYDINTELNEALNFIAGAVFYHLNLR